MKNLSMPTQGFESFELDLDKPCYAIVQLRLFLRKNQKSIKNGDIFKYSNALLHLGTFLGELRRYPESIQVLSYLAEYCGEEASELKAKAWNELATQHVRRGLWQSAEYWSRKAMAADSLNYQPLYQLLTILISQNDWQRVQLELPTLENPAKHYWTGMVLRAQERWQEALDEFRLGSEGEQADEESEDLEEALMGNWQTEQKSPRGLASLLLYGRWLSEKEPKNPRGYILQSSALAEFGREQEAWRFLLKSWSLKDASFTRNDHLEMSGKTHRRLIQYDKAARFYQRIRRKLVVAGKLWLLWGNFKSAERCLRSACAQTDVFLDEALGNLGSTLRAQGRYKEATECFKAGLELVLAPEKEESFKIAIEDLQLTQELLATNEIKDSKIVVIPSKIGSANWFHI